MSEIINAQISIPLKIGFCSSSGNLVLPSELSFLEGCDVAIEIYNKKPKEEVD